MTRAGVEAPMRFPRVLQIIVLIGGAVLVAGVFLFTHFVIQRLSREVATTSRVFARFCARPRSPPPATLRCSRSSPR